MKKYLCLGMVVALAGCQGAITSQVRESGEPGSSKATRCVLVKTDTSQAVNNLLKPYDGWKLVFVSQQAAGLQAGNALMCFEKPFSEKAAKK